MADIRNPATGKIIAEVQSATADAVTEAAEHARAAQAAWASRPLRERIRVVRSVGRWVAAHADELAALICSCTGKPRIDALSTEVLPATIMCDYYSRRASDFLAQKRLRASTILFINKRSTLVREPYGVVGIISPWNYPLGIPLHEVIAGLLSGNAVLLKVATQVQPVGDAIATMFRESGLPDGLLHVLHVPGAVAGDALLDAGIGKLFFTGSTAVGRELATKAGERLIPVSLELGGNDAMIVRHDADLERAAGCAVWAGLSNAGQSCAGVERIYVHAQVFDAFVAALRWRVERLRVGPDVDMETDVGSLTTSAQLETVRAHLSDAVARGGSVVAQSQPVPAGTAGMFHPAVVVANADPQSALLRDETFGPLLAVTSVRDDEEALRLANDSIYGLTASVWTRDTIAARSLSRALEAGTVTVNDHLLSHGMPETPWGGFKESGIGRSHGQLGFEAMTRPKVIVEERFSWIRANMWWHPYSRRAYEGLAGVLQARYGSGLGRRMRGLLRAVSLFLRRARSRDCSSSSCTPNSETTRS